VTDCVFCGIVHGDVEHSSVYEDERVVAFLDIQPVVRGHLLVVPREHAANLADLDGEDGAAMFETGRRAAAALRVSGLRCEGVNLFVADGEAAGQDVFHVHLHVIPRYEGDGFSLRFPPDYAIRPREELDEAASAIRGAWS
jgi:diadenosine tetraphosphate (Ap4A) HIT family hydrolase